MATRIHILRSNIAIDVDLMFVALHYHRMRELYDLVMASINPDVCLDHVGMKALIRINALFRSWSWQISHRD